MILVAEVVIKGFDPDRISPGGSIVVTVVRTQRRGAVFCEMLAGQLKIVALACRVGKPRLVGVGMGIFDESR